MIIELSGPRGDLLAYQVLLTAQSTGGPRPHPGLRGYLFETIERVLLGSDCRATDDFLTREVSAEIEPILASHHLALKRLALKPLRLTALEESSEATEGPPRDLSPSPGFTHRWVEAAVGPIHLKDHFLLTVEVVARLKASSSVLDGPLPGEITRASDWLINDIRRALYQMGPKMTLEHWHSSGGRRSGALSISLRSREFLRWLERAHTETFGRTHPAGLDGCWITDNRIEAATDAFRPLFTAAPDRNG